MKIFTISACIASILAFTSARSAEVPACDKNHFILHGPAECGVPALHASIGAPSAVAVDKEGHVYFSSPNVVYRLDGAGLVRRIAGDGSAGFSGDGDLATRARLNFPETYPELENDPYDFTELVGALAVGPGGDLYVADVYNNRIRRIDRDGIITTVAGSGPSGYVLFSETLSPSVTDLRLWWPQAIGVGAKGNLMVADGAGRLLDIAADGMVTYWAPGLCGPGYLGPGFCAPNGLALRADGHAFVSDSYCRVREASAPGIVVTVVGLDWKPDPGSSTFTCGYAGEDIPASAAALSQSYGLAIDAAGQLFIAETYADCIRKVDTHGVITAFAGRCGRFAAGSTRPGLGDGGPATEAQLSRPHGVAVDAAGNVYIADTGNFRIRRVDPDGIMTTVAGNGLPLATKDAFMR